MVGWWYAGKRQWWSFARAGQFFSFDYSRNLSTLNSISPCIEATDIVFHSDIKVNICSLFKLIQERIVLPAHLIGGKVAVYSSNIILTEHEENISSPCHCTLVGHIREESQNCLAWNNEISPQFIIFATSQILSMY